MPITACHLVVVGLCAVGLILKAGPWHFWVGGLMAWTFFVACDNVAAAICMLILVSPFNQAIRWVCEDSLLVRPWRDLIVYGLVACFMLSRRRLDRHVHSVAAMAFIAWCILLQFIHAEAPLHGVLAFRQLTAYAILFPVTVAVCLTDKGRAVESLLTALVSASGVICTIQLAAYFGVLRLPMDVSPDELLRPIGVHQISRMMAIQTGSPSGLAIYALSASMIAFARLVCTGRMPRLWWACVAVSLTCAFLTASHSALVGMLLGWSVIALFTARRWATLVWAAGAALAAWPLFVIATLTGKTTFEYAMVFLTWARQDFVRALDHFFLGAGVVPTGYLSRLVQDGQRSLCDGGWGLLALQVGIPAALMMVLWCVTAYVLPALSLYQRRRSGRGGWLMSWYGIAAFAGGIIYFVNAHGVPWSRPGADVNFFVLTSILLSLYWLDRRAGQTMTNDQWAMTHE